MLNGLWLGLLLASAGYAAATGSAGEASGALLEAGEEAVHMTLTLLASMTLWSGLMEILQEAGDVERLGRLFRRMLSPLFGGLHDAACWEAMSMNLAANLLGLGNAATPAGVRAAQLLTAHGRKGLQALTMLLILNNAGLQLAPTTVIALRRAAGSMDPAGIWLPSVAASLAAVVVSVAVLMMIRRRNAGEEDV